MHHEPIDHKRVAAIRLHHERVNEYATAYDTWSLEDLQLALHALNTGTDLIEPDIYHARRCALIVVLSYAFER